MIIDIHVHTAEFSGDSELNVEAALGRARDMGMGGICLTDHESMGHAPARRELERRFGLKVFVGAEILTRQGDLLVFGLDSLPGPLPEAGDLIASVEALGGVAVSAHPFRDNGRGMGKRMGDYPLLHGVEAFNGNTDHGANMEALLASRVLDLPVLAGSDAHFLSRLGVFATRFPDSVRDMTDLTEAIRVGEVEPVAYSNGRFHSIVNENKLKIA